MRIETDSEGRILNYAEIGSIDNSCEVDSILFPPGFTDAFWQRKWQYKDGVVTLTGIPDPQTAKDRVAELRQLLEGNIRIGAEIAMGLATREQYADEIARAAAWTEELNALLAQEEEE